MPFQSQGAKEAPVCSQDLLTEFSELAINLSSRGLRLSVTATNYWAVHWAKPHLSFREIQVPRTPFSLGYLRLNIKYLKCLGR